MSNDQPMLKLGETSFTTGRAKFLDRKPGSQEPTAKIYVTVKFPSLGRQSLAQLDTGAAWSVLEAEIAEALGVLDGDGEPTTMRTHLGEMTGRLERVPLTLIADEGTSLEVEATFLVSPEWSSITFLGYTGLLDRIRIALDPPVNWFYFGESE